MANSKHRAIAAAVALAQFCAGFSTAGDIHTLAEQGKPLPAADYQVVIDGTTAAFYMGAELVASGHLQAAPADKQDLRAEALGFAMQVAGHFEQADNAIFLIISDRYIPPHYEALIQGIRLTKPLHHESQ